MMTDDVRNKQEVVRMRKTREEKMWKSVKGEDGRRERDEERRVESEN